MKISLTVTILATFFSVQLTAQVNDTLMIRSFASEALRRGEAYENLRFLCKKIGPRLSGSANAEKAVAATARMLLEAGADTVYLQPCMVPHWERGAAEKGFIKVAGVKKRNLRLCALGNSVGTSAGGVEAGIVEVRSLRELHRLGKAGLSGRIVFLNFEMDPAHVHTFLAYGESGFARWGAPTIAAEYGAIGAMVRSLASNADDYPHTGVTVYNDSFPKIPAVAISTNDANWLSRQLKLKMQVTAFFETHCRMLPDAPSFNVVGELRGSQFPEQVLTVGGHLDSWDLGEGAHDDGAGVGQSIEVIRLFKKSGIAPKRTIRAVMFMNEENGGRGGKQYAELAIAAKEKHVLAIESDAGGFSPRAFSFETTDSVYAKLLQWKPLLYHYGVYEFRTGGSGADVGHLKPTGATLAGLIPDSQRYFDVHHAATDIFETVNRRELLLGAVCMAALVYLADKYGL